MHFIQINKRIFKHTPFSVLLFVIMLSINCSSKLKNLEDLSFINLKEGFKISVYFEGIENARSMAIGKNGTLFVSSRKAGNVYAIVDSDHNNTGDKLILIASGLDMPNGVEFKDGDLYVAEVSRIIKYENIENRLDNLPSPVIVRDDYPTESHHGWKYIKFGPDGKLYVPVGAPCNICKSDDPIYASITSLDLETNERNIFCHGVRNTVGFAWHPETGDLWFTDNGRDWLGDDLPNDELNRAYQKGLHFGYPYCHAGDIPDPEYGDQFPCSDFIPPAQKLGPHVAGLGMIFYTGSMFPDEYKNQVLLAEHGSWNRSNPIGYKISLVKIENNTKAVSYETFADGWLQGTERLGRPVDIIQMEDGSILVSDDYSDRIYRITYGN